MQFLVSAVKEDVETLAERMNLQADAIIVNQCDENAYREYTYQGHTMKCYSFAERGVGPVSYTHLDVYKRQRRACGRYQVWLPRE